MKDERDGPIHPEDHPLVPVEVRMGLQEMRHRRELAELQVQLSKARRRPMIGKILYYAFWTWTVYVTLAYFGFLGEAQELWNSTLNYLRW